MSVRPSMDNLPDELFEAIFRSLDDSPPLSSLPSTPSSIQDKNRSDSSPKLSWKSCSLVCKRWHAIVLPHLFRSTFLNGAHCPGSGSIPPTRTTSYTSSSRSVSLTPTSQPLTPCVQFFVGTPRIASLVVVLGLENFVLEEEEQLDRLLECLTGLKVLSLVNGVFWDGRGNANVADANSNNINEEVQHPKKTIRQSYAAASHAIDLLVYHLDKHYLPLVQCANFIRVLGLFTEIGELRCTIASDIENFRQWPTEKDVDMFVERTLDTWTLQTAEQSVGGGGVVSSQLRVGKLSCRGESIGVFVIPMYLLRLGALKNLTHLTCTLTYNTEWKAFFDVVSAARSTLTSLSIEVAEYDIDYHTGFDDIADDIATLQPLLTACTALNNISIIMHLSPMYPNPTHQRALHPDGYNFCYIYMDHRHHWDVILRLLQSLNGRAPIRNVRIGLRGTCTDPHGLDWKQFAEWCLSRLVVHPEDIDPRTSDLPRRTLEKIEVELWQVYDQRPCMLYEMREVLAKLKNSNRGVFEPRFDLPGVDALVIAEERMKRNLTVERYECRDMWCQAYRDLDDIFCTTEVGGAHHVRSF